MSERARIRIAVVQPSLRAADVERSLRRVADLVSRAAREHGPDLILLPDGITSPIVYSPRMLGVARDVDGEPYETLRRLAREHGCWVAGGFNAVRGEHARSTYVLAEPGGATHLHDKDLADPWESHIAMGNYEDDGYASTSLGAIGLVSGLEWLRSRTMQRLSGYVSLVAGGACGWAYPAWARRLLARDDAHLRGILREAPRRMAQVVGAPVAIAQQVGDVTGRTPFLPGVPWPMTLPGGSQIVDRDGRILARIGAEEGEGHVAADVEMAPPQPGDPLPPTHWATALPATARAAWLVHGWHGRVRYRRRHRARTLPWQRTPAREDLLAYNPAGPLDQRPERLVVARAHGSEPLPDPAPESLLV